MKKIVSLVLVLALIPVLLLPVNALDGSSNLVWQDLIANGYVRLDSSYVPLYNSKWTFIPFNVNENFHQWSNLQIYFRGSSTVDYRIQLYDGTNYHDLDVTYLGKSLYVASWDGNLPLSDGVGLDCKASVDNAYFEIYSIRGSNRTVGLYADPSFFGFASLYATRQDGTYHAVRSQVSIDPSTSSTLTVSSVPGSDQDITYDAYFYFYPQHHYDYLNFYFRVHASSVDSVTANNNAILDYEVHGDGASGGNNQYRVTVQLDCRNGDLDLQQDTITIHIMGRLSAGTNSITLEPGWCGWVLPSDTSNANWFNRIRNVIYNTRDGIVNAIAPISSWISAQTVSINSTISSFSQTVVSTWTSYRTALFDKLDLLINGDKSDSNDFNQSVNQAQNDIDNANAVIDSVTKPPVSDINISMDNIVSPSDMVLVGGLFNSVFQNSLLFNVFFMGLTLSLVGYVIFGKRG